MKPKMLVCQYGTKYLASRASSRGLNISIGKFNRVTVSSKESRGCSFLPEIHHPLYYQPPPPGSSYQEARSSEEAIPTYPHISPHDSIELYRVLKHDDQTLIMLLTATHFVSIHTLDGQYHSSGHLSGRETGYDDSDRINPDHILRDVRQREHCVYFNDTKSDSLCGMSNRPPNRPQRNFGPTGPTGHNGFDGLQIIWPLIRPPNTYLPSYQEKYVVWNDRYIIMVVEGGMLVYDLFRCQKVTTIVTGSTMIKSITVSNHQDWTQAKILCVQDKCWCSLECWSTQAQAQAQSKLDFILSHPIETLSTHSEDHISTNQLGYIHRAEFSPDNKYIWTCCDEGLRVYDQQGHFVRYHQLKYNSRPLKQIGNNSLTTTDGRYQLVLDDLIGDKYIRYLCYYSRPEVKEWCAHFIRIFTRLSGRHLPHIVEDICNLALI